MDRPISDTTISLRIDSELLRQSRAMAAANHMSFSAFVKHLLVVAVSGDPAGVDFRIRKFLKMLSKNTSDSEL